MAEYGFDSATSKLATLESLTQAEFSILLAAPGAGKTTELERLVSLLADRGEFVHLEHFGDLTDQASLLGVFQRMDCSSLDPDGQAFLILDGWDESPLQARARTRLVTQGARQLDSRVRLVITSRTAAWADQSEVALRGVGRDLRTYHLAPLTSQQAEVIALEQSVAPDAFWAFVKTTGTGPLLGTPMMVEMIASEAKAQPAGDSSLSQADLFDRATLRMAGEPDPLRNAIYPGRDVRVAAGALAAFALLGGARAISLADEVPESVLDARVLEGLEVRLLGIDASVTLSRPLFVEVEQSALCTAHSGGQFWFQSQSVAEFLAAQTLVACGIPATLIQSLMRGNKGLVPAQVQGFAAWLAALAPSEYGSLLSSDPLMFLVAGLEIEDGALRRALIMGIFELATQRSLPSEIRDVDLRGLSYKGLADDAKPYLTAQHDNEVRFLAIRVIRANKLLECEQELAAVVLNNDDDVWVRNSAAHALIDMHSALLVDLFRGLLTAESLDRDEDDQLLGAGLLSGLAAGQRISDLVPFLRFEGNPDLFGSLAMAVSMRLPEAVQLISLSDHNEILRLLEWVEEYEGGTKWRQRPSHERRSGDLLDAILFLGAQASESSPDIKAVVQRITTRRLEEHRTLLFGSHYNWREPEKVPQAGMRALVGTAAPLLSGESGRYGGYLILKAASATLDLRWLLEGAQAADGDDALGWTRLVDFFINPRDPDHLAMLMDLDEGTPLYDRVASRWIARIEPDGNGGLRVSGLDDDTDALAVEQLQEQAAWHARLRDALSSSDDGAFGLVWVLLDQAPRDDNYSRSASDRIEDLPGFITLDEHDRDTLTVLARRYLTGEEAVRLHAAVLSELGSDRISFGSLRVVAALDWLMGRVPEAEMVAHLQRWGATLFHAPFNFEGDGGDELLTGYRQAAPEDFLAKLALAVTGDRGRTILAGASAALDESAQGWLQELSASRSVPRTVRCEAAAALTRLDPDEARRVFVSLMDSSSHQLSVEAAVRASSADVIAETWGVLRPRLTRRRKFAIDTFLALAYHEEPDVGRLIEKDIAWLWRRLQELFPPAEDPVVRGVHAVSHRESVAHYRDRLLPALAQRGTPEAVEELEKLKADFVEHQWIGRLVADAQRRLSRETWSPLAVDLLRSLWVDWESKIVVASSGDLLRLVTDTLDGLQATIAKDQNPEATLLWNHRQDCKEGCRPKSEDDLNDYVARRLRERLPGRLILREVEVSRRSTKGIGQRADLLVSAMTPQGDHVHVVVEGKGCWNNEIRTAIPQQLVERYMNRYTGAAGLLLVYWFDPGHFRDRLVWMGDAMRGDKASLIGFVETEAGRATSDGNRVSAYVLDASLDW